MQTGNEVASPCIDVCALDDDGYCLGCLRNMDEISAWPGLDESGRQDVLAELDRRRAGLDPAGTNGGDPDEAAMLASGDDLTRDAAGE